MLLLHWLQVLGLIVSLIIRLIAPDAGLPSLQGCKQMTRGLEYMRCPPMEMDIVSLDQGFSMVCLPQMFHMYPLPLVSSLPDPDFENFLQRAMT